MELSVVEKSFEERVLFQRYRANNDEKLVRKELVQAWTRVLEKYAQPGMPVPPIDAVRRELIKVGTDAAIEALVDEHWFLFSFMVRDDIRERIEEELNRFDLADFLEDVREAQKHPDLLHRLREKIHHFVIEGR